MRYVAGKLRKAAARDLTKELRKGQREAFKPLEAEIKAEAAATLPKRGGYAATMARAVKVTVTARVTGGGVLTARIFARGKGEERDVRAVNAGVLRAPLFGRRRHWFRHRVRRGFVDRPADRVMDRVLVRSAEAAERVLREIGKG